MGPLGSLSQNGLDSTAIVMGVAGKQLSVVMALASALCINNSVNPAATALNTKPLKTVAQSILNKSMTHIDPVQQEKFQGWGNNATIKLFDGTPYLEVYRPDDNWGTLLTGSGMLSVYRYTPYGFDKVCSISFTPAMH